MGVLKMAERFYMNRTDNVICVSQFIEKWIRKEYGRFKNSVVINNGVDTEHFQPMKKEVAVRKFSQLRDSERPIVLFSGRLLAMKGIYTFIEASAKLLKKGTDVKQMAARDVNPPPAYHLAAREPGSQP